MKAETTGYNAVAVNFPASRLTRKEAAQYLGTSIEFLEQDAVTGRHKIPMVRVGRKVFYLISDLDAWLFSRRVIPGSCVHGDRAVDPEGCTPPASSGGDHE
ncbi:MAG: helix-turn-helix domain-containing protein [Rhodospirillaceae bacterium]